MDCAPAWVFRLVRMLPVTLFCGPDRTLRITCADGHHLCFASLWEAPFKQSLRLEFEKFQDFRTDAESVARNQTLPGAPQPP
ncbi:hypothetical protein ACRRTK_012862 [Alexandromys fortis]